MDLKQVKTEHGVMRKRGRPAGKNRVPLSHVERRARNAQYERERRSEMAEALEDLAKAADCESSITNHNLLVTVVAQLRRNARRKPNRDADALRRCNENLMSQIAALEQQLNETHPHDIGCSPLPEYSSPERKYSPPPVFSSGQEALTEVLPGFDRVSEPDRNLTHVGCSGLNSPKREFMPFEDYPPPTVDQFSSEHGQVDLSLYKFADEQIPTPEYRITSGSPEFIVPEPQHFLHQEDTPNRPESASLTAASVPHYNDPYLSQPMLISRAPTRHDNDASTAGLHVRNTLISSGLNEGTAGFDHQIHLLSTEELISMYLSS